MGKKANYELSGADGCFYVENQDTGNEEYEQRQSDVFDSMIERQSVASPTKITT